MTSKPYPAVVAVYPRYGGMPGMFTIEGLVKRWWVSHAENEFGLGAALIAALQLHKPMRCFIPDIGDVILDVLDDPLTDDFRFTDYHHANANAVDPADFWAPQPPLLLTHAPA